jgi:hypothetical protein
VGATAAAAVAGHRLQLNMDASLQGLGALPAGSPAGLRLVCQLGITPYQLRCASSASPEVVRQQLAVAANWGLFTTFDPGIANITYTATSILRGGATHPLAARRHVGSTVTTNARWRHDTNAATRMDKAVRALLHLPLPRAAELAQKLQYRGRMGRLGRRDLDAEKLQAGLVAYAAQLNPAVHAAIRSHDAPAYARLGLTTLRTMHGGELHAATAWVRAQALRDRGHAAAAMLKRAVRAGEGGGFRGRSRNPVLIMGDGLRGGASPGTHGGAGRAQASMDVISRMAAVGLGWSLSHVSECWTSQCCPLCGGCAQNPVHRFLVQPPAPAAPGGAAGAGAGAGAGEGPPPPPPPEWQTGTCSRALRCVSCRAVGNRDGWAARSIAGVAAAALLGLPPLHAPRYGALWRPRQTQSSEQMMGKAAQRAAPAGENAD